MCRGSDVFDKIITIRRNKYLSVKKIRPCLTLGRSLTVTDNNKAHDEIQWTVPVRQQPCLFANQERLVFVEKKCQIRNAVSRIFSVSNFTEFSSPELCTNEALFSQTRFDLRCTSPRQFFHFFYISCSDLFILVSHSQRK